MASVIIVIVIKFHVSTRIASLVAMVMTTCTSIDNVSDRRFAYVKLVIAGKAATMAKKYAPKLISTTTFQYFGISISTSVKTNISDFIYLE